MFLPSLISIIINWLRFGSEFEVQQCIVFSSWASMCELFFWPFCLLHTPKSLGGRPPPLEAEMDVLILLRSVPAGLLTPKSWASSPQIRHQEGKILMSTQAGGEHVGIPSQPRGTRGTPSRTEELAAQQVSSRGAVFPGPLSDSELLEAGATPYSSLPCSLYPHQTPVTDGLQQDVCQGGDGWMEMSDIKLVQGLESAGERKALCFCSYCQLFIAWPKKMQHATAGESSQNFLEP